MATTRVSAGKTAAKRANAKKAAAKNATSGRRPGKLKAADSVVSEPLRAVDMSPSERDATQGWFDYMSAALGKLATKIAGQIAAEPTGDRKDDLLKIKGQILAYQQILDRLKEAFFAEGRTETMRAPSADQVKRTRELLDKLGDAIAKQKEAQAIAKLASDLGDLALKISQPG